MGNTCYGKSALNAITVDMRMIHHSGIGTYLQNVVPRLVDLLPSARFHLLGPAQSLGRYPWTSHANVCVHDCRSPIYSLSEQFELFRRIPADTDLFWAPHYNIPLMLRGPLVVTVHDLFHLAMPGYVGGIHKRLYARLMLSATVRKAGRIICPTSFTADELARHLGLIRERVRVIHQGVSKEWFDPPKGSSPHSKPYLLYVGNVKPNKNLAALLAAIDLLGDRVSHDMVIVGKKEGFITEDRAVFAKATSLGDRVVFTGRVDADTLRRYYANADCLVFPSLYEGFGLPPLEAMASGCPVIVSNAASLPEVCGDGALYCDPHSPEDIASKIAMLLGDAHLQDELRRRGRERARLFTWEDTAKQTLMVLEEVFI